MLHWFFSSVTLSLFVCYIESLFVCYIESLFVCYIDSFRLSHWESFRLLHWVFSSVTLSLFVRYSESLFVCYIYSFRHTLCTPPAALSGLCSHSMYHAASLNALWSILFQLDATISNKWTTFHREKQRNDLSPSALNNRNSFVVILRGGGRF